MLILRLKYKGSKNQQNHQIRRGSSGSNGRFKSQTDPDAEEYFCLKPTNTVALNSANNGQPTVVATSRNHKINQRSLQNDEHNPDVIPGPGLLQHHVSIHGAGKWSYVFSWPLSGSKSCKELEICIEESRSNLISFCTEITDLALLFSYHVNCFCKLSDGATWKYFPFSLQNKAICKIFYLSKKTLFQRQLAVFFSLIYDFWGENFHFFNGNVLPRDLLKNLELWKSLFKLYHCLILRSFCSFSWKYATFLRHKKILTLSYIKAVIYSKSVSDVDVFVVNCNIELEFILTLILYVQNPLIMQQNVQHSSLSGCY